MKNDWCKRVFADNKWHMLSTTNWGNGDDDFDIYIDGKGLFLCASLTEHPDDVKCYNKVLTKEEIMQIYKENKMKERVEMPNKSTVLAVARKCPDAKDVLKGLFPEAFEEKEIELRDGQIYLNRTNNWYYVLHQHGFDWKLINIKYPSSFWGGWESKNGMKNVIADKFTLCPNATITVKENIYNAENGISTGSWDYK